MVGPTLLLSRQPYTVVGVSGRDFRSNMIGVGIDVFLPMVQFPPMNEGRDHFDDRRTTWFQGIGLLAPGASLETVNVQLGGRPPPSSACSWRWWAKSSW